MTWHSFFDLSTMEERHLLASYAVVLLVQGGFLLSIILGWRALKNPRS
jgi:hypothetical protein